MKKKANRIIEEELRSAAPDLKDRIKASVDWNSIAEKNAPAVREPKRRQRWIPALSAACAMLLIIGLSIGLIFRSAPPATAYAEKTVVLSINPSVEFTVKDDIVTAQRALNRDGVKLLLKEDFTGYPIEESLNRCVLLASRYGYFENTREIAISVTQDGVRSENSENELIQSLDAFIDGALSGTQLTFSHLTEKKLDELLDAYDERQMTEYEIREMEAFKEKLLAAVDEKVNRLQLLSQSLAPFGSERGDKEDDNTPLTAEELATVNQILDDFTQTYRLPFLSEYDRTRLKRKDIDKIAEEIEELTEELHETKEELLEDADEDDYEDQLEDLFELVLIYLNGDDENK